MSTVTNNTHQSRWGFHPCSKETSKKLRYMNRAYDKALHMAAVWERWDRKAPHNRVEKRPIKDDQGNRVGTEIVGPWKEPEICELFHEKVVRKTNYSKDGRYHNPAIELTFVEDNGFGELIREAAKQARTPQPSPEAVKPLRFTDEEIDRLYDVAKAWLEG